MAARGGGAQAGGLAREPHDTRPAPELRRALWHSASPGLSGLGVEHLRAVAGHCLGPGPRRWALGAGPDALPDRPLPTPQSISLPHDVTKL